MPPPTGKTEPSTAAELLPTEAREDVPQPSIEVRMLLFSPSTYANQQQTTEDHIREDSFQEQAQGEAAASDQSSAQNEGSQQPQNQQNTQIQGLGQQWPTANGIAQGMNGGGLEFDGMNSGFPTMAFANPGDFNAMMQFMPNNLMNGFPNMMG